MPLLWYGVLRIYPVGDNWRKPIEYTLMRIFLVTNSNAKQTLLCQREKDQNNFTELVNAYFYGGEHDISGLYRSDSIRGRLR